MLFKSVLTLSAILASVSLSVNATIGCDPGFGGMPCKQCVQGTWSPGGTFAACQTCPDGTTTQGQGATSMSDCKPCPAGTFSTGGANCLLCADSTYSTGGAAACTNCPPGQGSTAEGGASLSSCQPCPAGRYSKGDGKGCLQCGEGFFSGINGSTGCCKCCQGWKSQDQFGSTQCVECNSNQSSNPGVHQCDPQNNSPHAPSCQQMASGFCPATGPTGPSTLPLKKRGPLNCRRSYTACPHISGRGGWDCVDTKNDPEMCGGCVSLDGTSGKGVGRDCTAIPNISIVKCKRGGCVIESCRKGFTLSEDGKSCARRVSHPPILEDAVANLFFPYRV